MDVMSSEFIDVKGFFGSSARPFFQENVRKFEYHEKKELHQLCY